ncbi:MULTISPECIES: hypothetical protein [unclassified Aeromicrobium]|uniref:hypothetical protein n=1 Tax=unclassified Aeromicrobium TaxID=2633570 RepID=UPI00288ABAEE|nr:MULTISPECIES: hypothetical protein [unclassified Aeromicrobium]
MIAPVTLDLDGMTFNQSTDEWVFEDWSGWYGGAPITVRQTDRTGHGATGGPGRRGARLLSVTGWRAGRRAELAPLVEELESLLADGQTGIFRVYDVDLGDRWVPVQLTGTIETDWDNPRMLEFQISLLALDSFKYGETSTASTTFAEPVTGGGFVWPAFPDRVADFGARGTPNDLTIRNAGKAPSSVRFIVDGPTPELGFQIVESGTGKTLSFLSGVPAGSQLVIDGKTGNATLDDVADRSGDVVVDEWPVLAPGAESTFTFESLAGFTTATLTAETTATYW